MTDERINAYLLGELPDEESERFEEECFAGEDWPAEVSLAEEDLIDAYLRGELTAERRRLFEQNYLTTEERRRRLATAAGLLRYVDKLGAREADAPAPRPAEPSRAARFIAFWWGGNWALRAGVAVGVVALVAGAVWVLRSRTPAPRSYATLTLTVADNNRAEGGEASRVKIPPNAYGLRIYLKLPDTPPAGAGYRAELADRDGEVIRLEGAALEDGSVAVEIPAAALSRGQYAIRLFTAGSGGAERRVGAYLFIVD